MPSNRNHFLTKARRLFEQIDGLSETRTTLIGYFNTSLGTAKHVVNERAIDVGAPEADGIKEDIVIRHKVSRVREFILHDLVIAGFTEHHQPT